MTLSECHIGSSALFKRVAAFVWSPRATWAGLASTTSIVLLAAVVAGWMRIAPEGRPSSGAANQALALRNSSGVMAWLSRSNGDFRKPTTHLNSGHSTASTFSSCVESSTDSDEANHEIPIPCHYESFIEMPDYDWSQATDVNHRRVECDSDHETDTYQSPFREIRLGLDRQFHSEYSPDRERFQDNVIQSILGRNQRATRAAEMERVEDTPRWIVFSAGAMGAGKTWTVKLLHEKGRFPLHQFVTVDPDAIRHQLPEYGTYVKLCPDRAGDLTRKESGMIAEILVKVALEQGRNVLVDGSLRNSSWYLKYFEWLRSEYKNIRIAIFHVTAPRHVILSRAAVRPACGEKRIQHIQSLTCSVFEC